MSGGKTAIWVAASALGVTGFGSDEPEASASMILGLERRSLGSQEFSTCLALGSEEASNLVLFPWGEEDKDENGDIYECITTYPNSYTNFFKAAGANNCPPGDAVTSIGACRAAGVALGIPYRKDVNSPSDGNVRPAGCFWDKNGRSYFNINLEADPGNWGGVGAICGGTWTGEAPATAGQTDGSSPRRLLSEQPVQSDWELDCIAEFQAYCEAEVSNPDPVCSVCTVADKTEQSEPCKTAANTFLSSFCNKTDNKGEGVCRLCTVVGGKQGRGGNTERGKTKCTIL